MNNVTKKKIGAERKSRLTTQSRYDNLTLFAGVLIALFPILCPYKLHGVSLNWILGGSFVLCGLYRSTTLRIMPSLKPLLIYTLISMLLSINGLVTLRNANNIINAEIVMAFDLFVYMMLWYYSDIDVTMRYAELFGYICCGYAVIQIASSFTGNTVPLGKLPFFEIDTGWVEEVWGYRFNSLFSEPSYFAIYLLPLFVYNFKKSRPLKTILFGIFLVLSSSSLGIISLMVVLVLRFVSVDFSMKSKLKFLMIFFTILALASIVADEIPTVESLFRRSFNKIAEIYNSSSGSEASENLRLSGYLNLFNELPIKEQLFGVGNGQLKNYFAERGIGVSNYSNAFVLSLLNFGIIGFITFIIFLIKLFLESYKQRTLLFWAILVIALGVDSLLFAHKYYWLVYFVIFANKKTERYSR